MSDIDEAVRAILAGELVVLPTDTVYGLVCAASQEQAALDLYRLKGRAEIQPTAIIAPSTEILVESIPELRGAVADMLAAVFPGPYTLVVPNPAKRFRWLAANRADTIGVRIPNLVGPVAEIVQAAGPVVATSANLPGGRDPCRLADVPAEILAGVAVAIDGGELSGTPSTVIDVSGPKPVILRVGAGEIEAVLERLTSIHT